jgi:hypothetical protein
VTIVRRMESSLVWSLGVVTLLAISNIESHMTCLVSQKVWQLRIMSDPQKKWPKKLHIMKMVHFLCR